MTTCKDKRPNHEEKIRCSGKSTERLGLPLFAGDPVESEQGPADQLPGGSLGADSIVVLPAPSSPFALVNVLDMVTAKKLSFLLVFIL